MQIDGKMLAKLLARHEDKAIVTGDGNTIYALWKGGVVIFSTDDGSFNKLNKHQLATFIRKNVEKKGAPVIDGVVVEENNGSVG